MVIDVIGLINFAILGKAGLRKIAQKTTPELEPL